MSWRLVKSDSCTLDRNKAIEYAAKHAGLTLSEIERKVDEGRVKKLAEKLRLGIVLPFNWAVVKYQGKLIRMNGHHSSRAIMEVGSEIPAKLSFHMDSFEAETDQDLVSLFRQFDQRWSSRSVLDICGAYMGINPKLLGSKRELMKVAADGISWCKRTVLNEPAPKGDDTYDLLTDEIYTSFFQFVNTHITPAFSKILMKREIMGAMWQTHEVSQSGASRFWGAVASGPDSFTDDTLPSAVLVREFCQVKEEDGAEFYRKEFMSSPSFYYRKSIKAWNAFCVGQKVQTLKVTRAKGAKGPASWPEVSPYNQEEEAAA